MPFSSRLIATEPVATPIEKIASISVAICWSAPSTFLTSGANCEARIAPCIQKKLIATMARNSRGMCIVPLISRHDERSG